MNKRVRTLLLTLQRDGGVNAHALTLAGLCAIVLLAFFVQALKVSIERGEALRAKQSLAASAIARRLPRDLQVSHAGPEAAEP